MHAGAGRSGWALMLRRCQGVVKGQSAATAGSSGARDERGGDQVLVRVRVGVRVRVRVGVRVGVGYGLRLG